LKSRSISKRIISGVVLAELFSALLMIATSVFYERHVHFRAFDVMLNGRAESILGAVGDADDAEDNVVLDTRSITVPDDDLFEVTDEKNRILGRSSGWPEDLNEGLIEESKGTSHRVRLGKRDYRFVIIRATRVIDPNDPNGGITHHVTVLYGAPTKQVWKKILEAVRFYSVMSLFLLIATAALIAWFLRGALLPLHELAAKAADISVTKWSFNPPEAALATKELAPLASAIEATLARLEQSFAQQRRFTSNAAHELKTSVAIIKSSLQLLAMRDRSPEEYRHGLEICLEDCARLENTVLEMLTLAKAEYELDRLRPLPKEGADMAEAVEENIRQFYSLTQLREISIDLVKAGSARVRLAKNECGLIVSNLLHNAIQHSPAGSAVTINLAQSDGFLTLIVEDKGEGIPPELLPHIFEPFYRADASRDRKSGGTGLGLAICKAICDRSGGSISITSTPGTGTRATVRLPSSTPASL
jgi:signal transduction histidine kinase